MYGPGVNYGSSWLYGMYLAYTLCVQNIRNTAIPMKIPGESYDPLLMSPVKLTLISVNEGEETG